MTKRLSSSRDGQRGKGGRREAYPHSRSPSQPHFTLIDMGFLRWRLLTELVTKVLILHYQYAHLFPSKQIEMAEKLDDLGKGDFENVS